VSNRFDPVMKNEMLQHFVSAIDALKFRVVPCSKSERCELFADGGQTMDSTTIDSLNYMG
jgi:hypothetical protein